MAIDPTRPWPSGQGGALALILFAALAASPRAAAAPADPLPQAPDWSAAGANPSSAPSPVPEATPAPETVADSPPLPDAASSLEITPTLPREPLPEPDPGVGVPAPGNWNLPDLTDPSDPFFQMDGLRLRFGRVVFQFTFGMSFEYNDNIFNTPTPRVADYITTLSPTFTFQVGDVLTRQENYVYLRYTPQPQIFAENSDQTTINENLEFSIRYKFPRLTEDFTFRYIKDSNPAASDIGRAEYRQYSINWVNSYAVGTRTAVEAVLQATSTDYASEIYTNYSTVNAQVRLAYEVSPKVALTLGPYVGLTTIENGGEQPFQGVQLGVQYNSLKKLAFRGNLGAQAVQYRGSNAADGSNDFITPTFSLGATYNASVKRSFSLDLGRAVQNSGTTNGQTYVNTSASFSVQQLLLRGWTVGLRLGYSALEYQGGIDPRTDTYVSVSPTLSYIFWRERCIWSVYYTRTQRFSDIEAYQFDANVLGTRLTIEF